jgi:hypothetical protein
MAEAVKQESLKGKFNHYACQSCGAITIAFHQDDGVTPFMLRCRATKGCGGDAYSAFYRGSQAAAQVPHVIWFRPTTLADLELALKWYPRRFRARIIRVAASTRRVRPRHEVRLSSL